MVDLGKLGRLPCEVDVERIGGEHQPVVAGITRRPGNAELKIGTRHTRKAEPIEIVDVALVETTVLFLVTAAALREQLRANRAWEVTAVHVVVCVVVEIGIVGKAAAFRRHVVPERNPEIIVVCVVEDINILEVGRASGATRTAIDWRETSPITEITIN